MRKSSRTFVLLTSKKNMIVIRIKGEKDVVFVDKILSTTDTELLCERVSKEGRKGKLTVMKANILVMEEWEEK